MLFLTMCLWGKTLSNPPHPPGDIHEHILLLYLYTILLLYIVYTRKYTTKQTKQGEMEKLVRIKVLLLFTNVSTVLY